MLAAQLLKTDTYEPKDIDLPFNANVLLYSA